MRWQEAPTTLIDHQTLEVGPQRLAIVAPGLDRRGKPTPTSLVTVTLSTHNFGVSIHDKDRGVAALLCTRNPALIGLATKIVSEVFREAGSKRLAVCTFNLEPEDVGDQQVLERELAVREGISQLRENGFQLRKNSFNDLGCGPIGLVTAFGGPQILQEIDGKVVAPPRMSWLNTQRLVEISRKNHNTQVTKSDRVLRTIYKPSLPQLAA